MTAAFRCLLPAFLAGVFLVPGGAAGLDRVKFRHDGNEITVGGEILVTTVDDDLLLLGQDGVMWRVKPDDLVERTEDAEKFKPLSVDEIRKSLLDGLPRGFEVHQTAHYLICHKASQAYATWTGALLERLYGAFANFWANKGMKLSNPRWPMVVVVYPDKGSYRRHLKKELGAGVGDIVGYYHMRSNRIVMYDLTRSTRRLRGRGATRAQINQHLSRGESAKLVATVVHEATHQIAFNCGLHTRLSDVPLWLSEGIAMYFETPDLHSTTGWRGIGRINRHRLTGFRKYRQKNKKASLKTLLSEDKRFRDSKTSGDAYAEAWTLTYFLLRAHQKELVAYLEMLSQKKPLAYDSPEVRLHEFEQHFGELEKLEADFLNYVRRLR